MEWITVLGLFAGACTSVAVFPQLIKAFKSKSVEDVSPGMFTVMIIGFSMWLIYGIIQEDVAIIATNGLSLILNGIMAYFLIKYKR
ncbi:SemiSWEET family sugar transporter [Litoribacter populi]|uniref:SemiSWEET family sugar transporter n=1 Tax=Litoribacter populi TaxID=2598460 RepID=UPI00117F34C5|nr:SemiSWEET transporter [Litoribacter populi]